MDCCTPDKSQEVINRGIYISSSQQQQQRECTLAGGTPKAKAKSRNTSEEHQIDNVPHQYCTPHQQLGSTPSTLYTPAKAATAPSNYRYPNINARNPYQAHEHISGNVHCKTGSPNNNNFTYLFLQKWPYIEIQIPYLQP